MPGDQRRDVDVADPVAVGQAERLVADERQHAFQATAGHRVRAGLDERHPPRLGRGAVDLHLAAAHVERHVGRVQGVVGEPLLDEIALVAEAHDELLDLVRGVDLHDVPEDRLAADLDHRLGLQRRLLAESRAQTAGEDHGFHAGQDSLRRANGALRTHHRHHRTGRLLPRRAVARARLRRARHGPPRVDGEVRSHRAPARPHHPAPGRPARPALARRHAARLEARRDLQPRRDELRRGVVDTADADGRVHRRRRDADARGRPRGGARGALLPGIELGDVRQGARGPADRVDPVLPPLAVRRGEGLRPLHHGQLPRVV